MNSIGSIYSVYHRVPSPPVFRAALEEGWEHEIDSSPQLSRYQPYLYQHTKRYYEGPSGLINIAPIIAQSSARDTANQKDDIGHLDGKVLSNRHKSSTLSPLAKPFYPSPKNIPLTYQYKPLIKHSDFRLVDILLDRDAIINCKISNESLDELPSYLAVSYAWGNPSKTQQIRLNGHIMFIAVSLHGVLKALREEALRQGELGQKAEPVRIWADALCINQEKEDERTQQIRLMTDIYSKAKFVAIWLGPEEDDSDKAIHLLHDLSKLGMGGLAAIASLYERDYWQRLWVVQEVSNAKSIKVYCGSTIFPWEVYSHATQTFNQVKRFLDYYIPCWWKNGKRRAASLNPFSYTQILAYQGPGSLPNLSGRSFLDVLRACRSKLASDPKDKVFGVLGVLSKGSQRFTANYNHPVEQIYTEVVKFVLVTTHCLDIICEAIHFPTYTGSIILPSFVPDWSHIPQTGAMGNTYGFSASKYTAARYELPLAPSGRLKISAVYLGTIDIHGIAVGTICTLEHYLMTFLHWRAKFLESLKDESRDAACQAQDKFCRTLSLGQVPQTYDQSTQWLTICYHLFATLISERLPKLPLDEDLRSHVNKKVDLESQTRRQFLQEHFGKHMMGRCFCRTDEGGVGMGCGLMLPGDVVVVPFGCSTPILLRPEYFCGHSRYRFVGDVYIHGYMYGQAIVEHENKKREAKEYVLC
ncbi:heterokaryon incompatibility protein-domain-containing protein [Tricladium varicosporioides]|nr:heterokaryon incompatibility protein-domain-containing protein [Hymenoscyphus varicosporioides]